MGLHGFERRLEALVEGVFSRAFRSGLQPVEIGRRLAREMDDRRTVGVHGLIAPNRSGCGWPSPTGSGSRPSSRPCCGSWPTPPGPTPATRATASWARSSSPSRPIPASTPASAPSRREIKADPDGRVGTLVTTEGRRIPVADRPVVIGRLSSCDIPLGDPQVSRRHAEVRRDPEGFTVFDLGSTNGTVVNGAPVRERRLADGDELRIGSATIRFETS